MTQRLHGFFTKLSLGAAVLLSPAMLFAQTVDTLLSRILTILGLVVPLLFGLALIFFLWGLAKFILSAGDASAQKEGRDIMIWGIIALFVMVAVWGLVRVLQTTFSLNNTTAPSLPSIPGTSSGFNFF